MKHATQDLSTIQKIQLPSVWSFQKADRILQWCHLTELATISSCNCTRLERPESKRPSWKVSLPEGEILLVREEQMTSADAGFANVLVARNVDKQGEELILGPKSAWLRHQKIPNVSDLRSEVTASWKGGPAFLPEERGTNGQLLRAGLRSAQLGALHAVAAHWTVSTKPALVVMPTGTGKTEVMLCCMVMRRPNRLLVIVPSDALRQQTFEKFCRLGVLSDIGVISPSIIRPVTGMILATPRTDEELKSLENCNVIVSTVAAVQGMPTTLLKKFAGLFDVAFFDEAHHLPAHSWDRIHTAVSDKSIIQFTATPFRLDGQRISGRIIYNFPLRAAQEQGYFRNIKFLEVFEPDPEDGDARVAELAVSQLRKDLADGFSHILLARAETQARAESLFKAHYQKHADLTPIIVHSKSPKYRQRLRDIKAGLHKIIVCVDMFGEGFDLPALKIAAMHDPHKSLAITLQFTGRFTRDARGIGDATLVANTADPRVSDSIEELYAEDSDWNALIPELSAKAIQSQIDFSEFLARMDDEQAGENEIFGLNILRPKTSTVIYKAPEFNPTRFRSGLRKGTHIEREWYSKDRDLLIFITRSKIPIEWATVKEAWDETWDLFILAYDVQHKLLFVHSSQTGSFHAELAKAVSGKDVVLVEGEKMFRAFHGTKRLTFHNAGLYSRGVKLRFRMYAGLDIVEAIAPSSQSNAKKSNMFAAGYEDGQHVSVGVSYKGRVWSMSSSSIPDWRAWCVKVSQKILNDSLPTDDYLKHTLIPKEIAQVPAKQMFSVSMPAEWYLSEMQNARLYASQDEVSLDALEIRSYSKIDQITIDVTIGVDEQSATFRLSWGPDAGGFAVKQTSGTKLSLALPRERTDLDTYLTHNPPTIHFLDGAEVCGGYLLDVSSQLDHFFAPSAIIVFDWSNIDITTESKWRNGQMRANSVQARIIDHLRNEPNRVVFDDDDSGEVADVVEISEEGDTLHFHLYHCKYSGGAEAGARVKDPAEVCAQAVRSLRWTPNPRRLLDHLLHRELKVLKGRPTRFEKGRIRDVANFKRRLRKLRCRFEITIVQPGISKAQCDPEIATMLGAASNLILDKTGMPLRVIASA